MAQFCTDTYSGATENSQGMDGDPPSAGIQWYGMKFTGSNALIGQQSSQITLYLKKASGDPVTGTATAYGGNSTGTVQSTGGTYDLTNLTDSYQSVPISLSHTIAEDDWLMINVIGYSGINGAKAREWRYTSQPTGTAVQTSSTDLNGNLTITTASNRLPDMCITYGAAPTTSSTLLPPPIAYVRL